MYIIERRWGNKLKPTINTLSRKRCGLYITRKQDNIIVCQMNKG